MTKYYVTYNTYQGMKGYVAESSYNLIRREGNELVASLPTLDAIFIYCWRSGIPAAEVLVL